MLVGALALGVVATAIYGITQRVGTARAATQNVTGKGICVQDSTRCLELEGNTFKANNPIIFNSWNATEERFRWHFDVLDAVSDVTYKPFTYHPLDTYYNTDLYGYIEKSTLTGDDGCAGMGPLVGGAGRFGTGLGEVRRLRYDMGTDSGRVPRQYRLL
jgi:hypothetical protein